MGSPKQLLRVGDETLVERAVAAAAHSRCSEVLAVVGAEAARVSEALSGSSARIVENPAWSEGLASSIRAGVAAARAAGTPDAVLVLLADQPGVDAAAVDALIAAWDGRPDSIVASAWAGGVGAPALFGSAHLDALEALEGDRGARVLLERHAERVRRLPLEAAARDIDTPDDYERYSK